MTTSEKLLDAAADLLRKGGVHALSTRAVAAAAGMQPPALYRQFGDKDGLIEAVTLHVLERYLSQKRAILQQSDDPVADLRRLWDLYVAFGFTHPECFVLIYGQVRVAKSLSTATDATIALLQDAIARVGDYGKLRMNLERATALFHSCGVGFVLTQLSMPKAHRDPELSDIARESALSAILITAGSTRRRFAAALSGRASGLRAALQDNGYEPLTPAEGQLMVEWLNRIANNAK
ncbi:TetR/AcrR family transcriptional regulator [Mycobacterium sp. AZCC_0083]|uniref:TetR/AcrR family transcriptional regulator n=1 Tax=Mycobacterium sp. AZCC_0083 TaxID=2735882 RepID=UPI001859C774|nr:TetR/AcrR family transcriptional regulator [Mycobacterium sp. AZCC_0083]MBB5167603.1 AcrR family transcriptional regulator [Mycobacterium sp. AZCC_0083]